ncbi:hypothetical protein HZ326_7788 [Fusarium oxysporum f. sp. albedinis]|nr:hypothetical protein HZ326_7788 [Fusarium oxysporum f. sp. albedinis]
MGSYMGIKSALFIPNKKLLHYNKKQFNAHLYQLTFNVAMSIIRGYLSSCNTPPDNQLSPSSHDMTGHELDWQAMKLESNHHQ